MKVRILLIITFFFSISLMAQITEERKENISVLFIGNSYTFMNDMPFTFQKLAKEYGVNAFVDTLVEGGKNLEFHSSRKETYDKINARNWTYVVIQGHSNEFATPRTDIEKKSKKYLARMVDSIRTNNSCTKVVFYMTWAYKNGNKNWEPINSYEKMQDMVIENYMWMAKDFNAILSPVGAVWQSVRKNHDYINLYNADEKHPNSYGSYLSAATFLATILKKSPNDFPTGVGIDLNDQKKIAKEVYSVVSNFSKWNNNQKELPMEPGFDLIVTNKKVKIFNHSVGGLEVKYKVNDEMEFSEADPEFTINRRDSELIVQQDVERVCKSVSLVRRISL